MVAVIDVRVRSFVSSELRRPRPRTPVRATLVTQQPEDRATRSGPRSASHAWTVVMCPRPSAAACISAARLRRPWSSQNSRSPAGRRGWTAASMSVARSAAVTGSAQPVSGSKVIVESPTAEPDRVEHVHRAPGRAQRGGLVQQIRAGGGHEHGAGGVDDLRRPAAGSCRCAGRRSAATTSSLRRPHPQHADPAQPHADLGAGRGGAAGESGPTVAGARARAARSGRGGASRRPRAAARCRCSDATPALRRTAGAPPGHGRRRCARGAATRSRPRRRRAAISSHVGGLIDTRQPEQQPRAAPQPTATARAPRRHQTRRRDERGRKKIEGWGGSWRCLVR